MAGLAMAGLVGLSVVFCSPIPLFAQPASPAVDIDAIPSPSLDQYEDGVTSQVEDARQRLARLAALEETSAPELADAVGLLGRLYLLYDFMDAARPALSQASALAPEDARWHYYLGVLELFDGNLDAAADQFGLTTLKEPRGIEGWIRLAEIQLQRGELAAARRAALHALDLEPSSSAAQAYLGRVLLDEGEAAEAVEWFRKALPGQPEGSVVNHHLGLALRAIGQRDAARHALRANKHVEIAFPDPLMDRVKTLNVSREAFFKRGTEALRAGDAEAALEAFRSLVEAEPSSHEGWFNAGMALIELGRHGEAETYLRKAIALRDDYRDPRFNLGLMLARRGDLAEAETQYRKVVEIDPRDLEAQVRLADVLWRVGKANESQTILEQVLAVDPALADARVTLGAALYELGKVEVAEKELTRVLGYAPGAVRERIEARSRLAILAMSQQPPRLAPAIEHLEAALTLAPGSADVLSMLARAQAASGDFAASNETYERLHEAAPEEVGAWFGHAVALMASDRDADAKSVLERGLTALPRAMPLEHALARLLAASADPEVRDGTRALALAEGVMQAAPSADHAETVAMALAELERFEEAARLQEEVISRSGGGGADPAIKERLARYQARQKVRAPWR